MELKSGLRLRSQVCTTEVIVIRPPSESIELTCGGSPMVAASESSIASKRPTAGLDTGAMLGKRYTTGPDDALEILVTKGGSGTLANGVKPLVLKEAKALPASD